MSIRKKKGFTLIELIAVLVIMAIIALIVTPLVMNIIRNARTAADKRSVDAYGRSIEIAIAGYLLDTGKFPTSMNQLTVEYKGDEVVCTTTQIKSDSSVYLAGCTVGGREVKDYTYGSEEAAPTYTAYKVGDEVKYNNVDYYVIKNSGVNEEEVQLLKKDPLTVAQVNQYGAGHVNMYVTQDTSSAYYQQAHDYNNDGTVGGMAYYTSATCGYNGSEWVDSGCTTDYAQSEVKYVVDAWKTAQAPLATNARLITLDDLTDNLGMELNKTNPTTYQITVTEDTPTWVMGENYWYRTMTTDTDNVGQVWYVDNRSYAYVNPGRVQGYSGAVRPVITLKKSAIKEAEEEIIDGNIDNKDSGNIKSDTNEIIDKEDIDIKDANDTTANINERNNVKAPNTLEKVSIVFILIGIVLVSISTIIVIKNKDLFKK